MTLIDPATAKWLVSEYGVIRDPPQNGGTVSRAQKHALVIRTCGCGRKIAGNAYFRHVRVCRSADAAARGDRSNQLESQQSNSEKRSVVQVNVKNRHLCAIPQKRVGLGQF